MTEIKMGTALLIDQGIAKRQKEQKPRDYMGGSMLGEPCDRKLYWDYKRVQPPVDARIQRIFDMGHILEDYAATLLRDAGLTLYTHDENGEQFGFREGEIAGHGDGVVLGLPEAPETPHLWEFKTMKNTTFNQYVKKGLKANNEKYWVQIHVYMKKFGLTRCLFMAMNKDNCEIYYERVEYDEVTAEHHLLRGYELAAATELPDRKYSKSTFYKCRFCNWNEECWA